jgi:hypothetical protein
MCRPLPARVPRVDMDMQPVTVVMASSTGELIASRLQDKSTIGRSG